MGGRLEITTVIGCSVNCVYCPQRKLITEYSKISNIKEMSFETFRYCLKKVPKNTRIDFSGMAEPWLNKKATGMVLHAHAEGYPIVVYTTLMGMDMYDIKALSSIRFGEFVIHLPDEKRNSKIDITDTYLEVLEYAVKNIPNVKFNCHAKMDMRIINIIGKQIGGTHLIDRAGNIERPDVKHRYVTGKMTCKMSGCNLNHNVLLPDGTVVLCCNDYGMEHILGNLLIDNYEDLHNSEQYKKIISAFNGEPYPVLCRKCIRAIKR